MYNFCSSIPTDLKLSPDICKQSANGCILVGVKTVKIGA